MVVVAIVGILSAVALPSFLNQSAKAKGTECAQKASGLLRQVTAEAAMSTTKANTLASSLATSESTDNCEIALVGTGIDGNGILKATVTGKNDLLNKYAANACINTNTNESEYEYEIGDGTAAPTAPTVSCA